MQPSLRFEDLNKYIISLPPLPEQQTIASYLDTKTSLIDEAISLKQQQIDLLKEKRTALINHVVTKGLDPNVEMVDPADVCGAGSGVEWIGKIPKGWEVRKLKYCIKMQSGFAFSSDDFKNDGVQLIRISNLYDNSLCLDRQPIYLSEDALNQYSDWIVQKGDILMSMTGTLGKRDYGFAILLDHAKHKYLLNQRVSKIYGIKDIDKKLLLHILHSEYFLNRLFLLPAGTKQGNLSNDNILGLSILLPIKTKEQQAIVSYLDAQTSHIDQTISMVESSIELLKEYKQSLISHVVTGKVKVF